jgi:hypothetical protein
MRPRESVQSPERMPKPPASELGFMKTRYVQITDKEETRNRVRNERRNINNGDRYIFIAKKGAGNRWKDGPVRAPPRRSHARVLRVTFKLKEGMAT